MFVPLCCESPHQIARASLPALRMEQTSALPSEWPAHCRAWRPGPHSPTRRHLARRPHARPPDVTRRANVSFQPCGTLWNHSYKDSNLETFAYLLFVIRLQMSHSQFPLFQRIYDNSDFFALGSVGAPPDEVEPLATSIGRSIPAYSPPCIRSVPAKHMLDFVKCPSFGLLGDDTGEIGAEDSISIQHVCRDR